MFDSLKSKSNKMKYLKESFWKKDTKGIENRISNTKIRK